MLANQSENNLVSENSLVPEIRHSIDFLQVVDLHRFVFFIHLVVLLLLFWLSYNLAYLFLQLRVNFVKGLDFVSESSNFSIYDALALLEKGLLSG